MLLVIGLMTSVYLIFLSLPGALNGEISKLKNHFMSRVTNLVVLVYLLFILDSLLNWRGEVVFLDGLCRINGTILTSEIFMLIMILTIIHLQGIYARRPELYLIILSNVIGLIYLISSNDWVITVTSWELFNLSLYLLVSINSSSEAALSASIKYFLLSSLSFALMLLGVALLYANTGSTHYDSIYLCGDMQWISVNNLNEINRELLIPLIPIGLIAIGFIFKLALFPLHGGPIDLYNSISVILSTWVLHIPKLGVLIFMMQILQFLQFSNILFILVGITSIIVGSIALGSQYRIIRFLAYSSMAHLGYLILMLIYNQIDSYLYYLTIYMITSITIFTIILAVGQALGREIKFINQLSGLLKLNFPLALAFSISLFSLMGMPALGGFFSKMIALQSFISLDLYWIALIAIMTSVISAAYYLYVIYISSFKLPLYMMNLTISTSISYIISLFSIFNLLFIFFPATFIILCTQLLSLNG